MALFGEEIKPAKKRARRDNEAAEGSASQRWAELQTREAAAGQARLNSINPTARHDPVSEPPPQHHDINNNDDDDDESVNPQVYDELCMIEEGDSASAEGNTEVVIPISRSAYYRSVTYQERTLTEEAHWRDVIPQIFRVFIPCSHKTRQWGDPKLWDFDWNPPCRCASWQKTEVEVDAVDILSGYMFTALVLSSFKLVILFVCRSAEDKTSDLYLYSRCSSIGLERLHGWVTGSPTHCFLDSPITLSSCNVEILHSSTSPLC